MEYLVPACMLLLIGLFAGHAAISAAAPQRPCGGYKPVAELSSFALAIRYYLSAYNVSNVTAAKSFHLLIKTNVPKPVNALHGFRRRILYSYESYIFVVITATCFKYFSLHINNEFSYMQNKHPWLILLWDKTGNVKRESRQKEKEKKGSERDLTNREAVKYSGTRNWKVKRPLSYWTCENYVNTWFRSHAQRNKRMVCCNHLRKTTCRSRLQINN